MSAIKKLTGVGGDIRQIAALLQSKGRRGDTMLAHITPQEAALLKSRGGAGTTNPETGLPEFYIYPDAMTDFGNYQADQGQFQAAPVSEDYSFSPQGQDEYSQQAMEAQGAFAAPPAEPVDQETVARAQQMGVTAAGPRKQPSLSDLLKIPQAVRPFLPAAATGGAAVMGAAQARKAQEQAQEYKRQQEQIAAPYRMRGQQMIGAAERGELTPVNRQTMEAVRAQLAQQVQGRGGVGAMQATEQIARLQQTLLQNQYDYGLKVANLGDQIAIGAIKTGMQADAQMRELMQNYMMGAARIAGGSPEVLGNEQQPAAPAARRV